MNVNFNRNKAPEERLRVEGYLIPPNYSVENGTPVDMKSLTGLYDMYTNLGIRHGNYHRALHAAFISHGIRLAVVKHKHCGIKIGNMSSKY